MAHAGKTGRSLDETAVALIETLKKCWSILCASKLLAKPETWLLADATEPDSLKIPWPEAGTRR